MYNNEVIFIEEKNNLESILLNGLLPEFLKYLVAGGIAFIFDFCITILLYKAFKIHYLFAAGIGVIVGMLIAYLLSIKWVFVNRSVTNNKIELGLFLLIGIIGFSIHEYIMWFSVETILINVPVSKIIATVIVFVWNFTARKIFLFSRK